ncbi:sulfite exporter TauE/SafE family protein [Radicibacter daui]|uniref:sulfite exporter TauE/SafE family protein n=1 Tax=Radicibacter daui TaxID=3064829 RepID=UPI004046E09B
MPFLPSAPVIALSLASGSLVGFSLGLIGGGGSILAVPLLLYVVGISDPHVAIGTSALAVSVNAFANLGLHARAGTVKWRCALFFSFFGVIGAFAGSSLGKQLEGDHLLAAFAAVMLVVALVMLRKSGAAVNAAGGKADVHLTPRMAPKLGSFGFLTGFASGFFGIGGGFLIVPGIMAGSGMAILNAIGSSLFSVGSFGLTTALNYAASGLVDWPVAGLFIAGGVVGGLAGMRLALRLAGRKGVLMRIFAGVIIAVALYMLVREALPLFTGA